MCTSEKCTTWNGALPDEMNFVAFFGAGFGIGTVKGVTGGC